ncbi:MAG: polysaccharide deacetylase family protein, partial [Waterburya sp.]
MNRLTKKIQRKLHRVGEQIQKQFCTKSLILMYHRVAEEDIDPWSLRVTPERFAEHLKVLQQHTQPLSLKELAQAHQEGNIRDRKAYPKGNRAVAITFDDGYANNLHQAKPLLEKYQIPATVFIATGYSEQPKEFWWDELEYIILQPGKLPDRLSLTINEQQCEWDLGTANQYTQEAAWQNRNLPAWKSQPG